MSDLLKLANNPLGRRKILRCSLGAACVPALAALGGCAPEVAVPAAIDVPAPVNNLLTIPVQRLPELLRPGGSILLHPAAQDSQGRPLSLLAANTTSQGLCAYQAYCPHAGCEVAWVDGADQVVCPCHLSRFSVKGTVVDPPAQVDLDTYPIKLSGDGQHLTIDLTGAGGLFPPVQNGLVTFTLPQLPQLLSVGGSVTSHSRGVPFPLLVQRTGTRTLQAFDARCPHLGCAVQGQKKIILCPCHGSIFGLDGSVKQGPALGPLTPLPVTFDGTTVVVKVS